MIEPLLIIYAFLFISTALIMLLYRRKIREGYAEYAKAKAVIDNVILSFNRDLRTQEEKIGDIANRSENASTENLQAIQEMKSDITDLRVQLGDLPKIDERLVKDCDLLRKNVGDLVSQQSELLERISELESLGRRIEIPETGIESAIPIRKDKALAPLTETELKILDLLVTEGEKTAPQIKDRIKLTREHTARLMKKLFTRGYVERKTNKIPYTYRLKKEMENFLKEEAAET